MPVDQSYTRVETLDVKALVVQRIGHQRAEKYFDHLRRLFSLKITKSEFNKLCLRTIGRENLSLHNHLITSIAKNACLSKTPPPRALRKKTGVFKTLNGSQKSPHHHHSLKARSSLRDRPSPLGPHGKTQQSAATELLSLGSRPPLEVASVEDGEEVEQAFSGSPGVQSRSPVTAPFGLTLGAWSRKSLCINNNHRRVETCQSSGEFPDTRSLRNRMNRKLESEGLSVSVDCANLLNNGLEAYLKRLVEPCLSLAGSRRGSFARASLLDFRAAMELNPRILGVDWAVQLEKIGCRASDED